MSTLASMEETEAATAATAATGGVVDAAAVDAVASVVTDSGGGDGTPAGTDGGAADVDGTAVDGARPSDGEGAADDELAGGAVAAPASGSAPPSPPSTASTESVPPSEADSAQARPQKSLKELSAQPSRFKAFLPPRANTAIFGWKKGPAGVAGAEAGVEGVAAGGGSGGGGAAAAAGAAGSPLTPPEGGSKAESASRLGSIRLASGRTRSKSRPRLANLASLNLAATASTDADGGVAVTGWAATRAHVLTTRPGLAPIVPARGWAPSLMAIAHNGVRSELVDMHVILTVCERNKMRLTHTAVDRFFEWYRLCQRFIASTVTIEEDLVIAPTEERTRGGLTGGLRLGARMKRRGRVQKLSLDVSALHEAFHPCLPAGEVLADLIALAGELTDAVLDYCTLIESLLPSRLEASFNRLEGRKLTGRVVKCHRRVSDDHVILMTRWMSSKAQVEFVATILMPSDFVCFSYHQWAKQVDKKHLGLARSFEDELKAELDEDDEVRRAHAAANLQRLALRANEHSSGDTGSGGSHDSADANTEGDGVANIEGSDGALAADAPSSVPTSADDADAVVAGDDVGLGGGSAEGLGGARGGADGTVGAAAGVPEGAAAAGVIV